MTELDHDDLRYAGEDGEEVTVTVEPLNTVQLVTYTLNGASHALPNGKSVTFKLKKKTGDAPTVLQMNFDYSNPSGGKYKVVVLNVENEQDNKCVHTFKQRGSLLSIKDFRFFIQ